MKKSFISLFFMVVLFVLGSTAAYAYEKIQVDSVDGTIWDYKDNRILFLDANHALKVKDLTTGQIATVIEGKMPTVGFLAPKGAIFLARTDGSTSSVLYDWRDGNLVEVGAVDPTLIVKDNFAVYNVGSTIYLRDLTTGESKVVTDKADEHGYDVAGNWALQGMVVWSNKDDHQIYSFLNGTTAKITNNPEKQHFSPITDGFNILYLQIPASGFGDVKTIAIHRNDANSAWMQEVVLGTSSAIGIPYQDYSVRNGYVASFTTSSKSIIQSYYNYGNPEIVGTTNLGQPIQSFNLTPYGNYLITTTSGKIYLGSNLISDSANAKIFFTSNLFTAEGGVLTKFLIGVFDKPPVNTVTPALSSDWSYSGWTNITEYTVTVTDDGTNVDFGWLLNNRDTRDSYYGPGGTKVKITEDGRYYLVVKSTDSGGQETYDTFYVNVDTIPPVTTSAVTPDGDRFSVTLSATDNLSGVKGIFYRINQGSWTQYYFPLKLTASEKDSLEFYSVDNAGNKEADVPTPPSDTTAPTTQLLANSAPPATWYNTDISVQLNASDGTAGSGIAKTFYRLNGGEWKEYSAPFALSPAGKYKVGYYSSDLAGNQETAKSVTLGIDKTAPVTTYKVTPVYGTDKPASYIKGYTVTLTASDDLSGVKATYYRVNGGSWTKYTATFNLQSGEDHTNLEFYSEDYAGNKEVHS